MGGGGVSPSYFLDEMTWAEVDAYLTGLDEAERTSWDQTRMIMYTVAQCNSRKKLRPKDILPLPWDDEKPQHEEIDWAEVERMRAEVKLEQQKNNGSK